MPYVEPYCMFCAADRFCTKKPDALPNLPGQAWPECFQDPETAVQVKEPGGNYELLF
jgi:hypothetical protein